MFFFVACIEKELKTSITQTEFELSENADLSSLKTYSINDEIYLGVFFPDSFKLTLFDKTLLPRLHFKIPNIRDLGMFYSSKPINTNTTVSIFQRGIVLANQTGSVLNRVEFKNPYYNSDSLFINIGSFTSENMEIIMQENGVLFPQYSMDFSYWDKQFYKLKQFVFFDTARQTYTEVPIKYPHIYSLNSYGNANNIVYTASGDRLFYGANASPDLFVYSFKDKSQKTLYSGNDNYQFNCNSFDTSLKSDMTSIFNHLIQNDYMAKLIYDDVNKVLYQLIWEGIPLVNEDKTFNTIKDKGLLIKVISSNGKFQTSQYLEPSVIWDYSAVLDGKLYLKNKKDEKFTCIDFFTDESS